MVPARFSTAKLARSAPESSAFRVFVTSAAAKGEPRSPARRPPPEVTAARALARDRIGPPSPGPSRTISASKHGTQDRDEDVPGAGAGLESAVIEPKEGAMAGKARRTTHRSVAGKKLYAVRDAQGRFKDIQTYERAHRADIKRKSKKEKVGEGSGRRDPPSPGPSPPVGGEGTWRGGRLDARLSGSPRRAQLAIQSARSRQVGHLPVGRALALRPSRSSG